MGLQDEITEAWKTAMKARDPRKDTLSLMRSEIKKEAINTRSDGASETDLDDDATMRVLGRMAKQRRESIVEYEKASRDDLASKEKAELAVVEEFLPAALNEAELLALVNEAIAQVGASGPQDMGKVMGPLMKKVGGRADGNAVRAVVQGRLQG